MADNKKSGKGDNVPRGFVAYSPSSNNRTISAPSDWKKWNVSQQSEFQGLQVFFPVDPYKTTERKDFRTAMGNTYVYRAARIQTTMVCGQGFSTDIMPRIDEDVDEGTLEWFKQQEIYVPYWDETVTMMTLKNRIDKLSRDMDLEDQVFNGYYTSLEQGRCVLALTPILVDKETNDYPLPDQIRYIRPEFTLRPIIDSNTSELRGCYVIGARSNKMPSAIEAKRMIYITHGFNNELFSDYYGDSKIARISDIANNLNLILNQDFERVAEQTWHKPNTWLIPIAPQDIGKEETIIEEFLQNNNHNAKGKDIAIPVSAIADERSVEKIPNASNQSGDIGGLDTISVRLIKSIVTTFGMPGFLVDEGTYGSLGGNNNLEQVDMWLNTEIRPERIKLENILEKQFYDSILCTLFEKDNPDDLEVKIRHKYNKPTIMTLLKPDMIASLKELIGMGGIKPESVVDILHLEQYQKDTMSTGAQPRPAGWSSWPVRGSMPKGWDQPVWDNKAPVGWDVEAPRWGKKPEGSWRTPSTKWISKRINKQEEQYGRGQ